MSSIIAFPSTLGDSVTKGGNHVSFEIIGSEFNTDVFKIHLFIPSGFALGDGANFGSIDLGVINAAESMIKKDDKGKNSNIGELEATAIGSALLQKLGVGSDLNAGAAAAAKAGVAINPQTTLTYEGANIRQFELSFQLVASSAKEAETIRVIEHTFRKYMYAKKEGDFALKYPPLFRVKFMKGKKVNKFLPFLFDSYLTGLNVTYNSDGNMYHKDGAPTDVTIGLSFQEQRQLTRDDLYHVPGENEQEKPPGTVQQKFDYPGAKGES
jgi:hypothetical protein